MGLLELVTVPMVAGSPASGVVGLKSPVQGALVGFVGMIVLLFLLNLLIPKLNLFIGERKVTGISILPSSCWNAIVLALLFIIQRPMMDLGIEPVFAKRALAGFTCASISLCCTGALYSLAAKALPATAIRIRTDGGRYLLNSFSVTGFSLLAGLYEGVALPVILLWQDVSAFQTPVSILTGLAGGIAGSLAVLLIYNFIPFPRIGMTFKGDNPGTR